MSDCRGRDRQAFEEMLQLTRVRISHPEEEELGQLFLAQGPSFELPFEGRKESGWSISKEDAGVIKVLRALGRGPGRWDLVYQGQ